MRPFFLALVLVAASCQWSEDRFAKRPISANELVGTWIGTDYSMKSLRDVGVTDHLKPEDHVLVLRQDGTCSVRTTFGLPPTSNRPATYRAYDSNCTWKLDSWETAERNRQTVRLTLPEPDRAIRFNLADERGQLIVWQYADDPDTWRYLEFARSGGAV
jgi:hypothetical protein